MTGGPSVGAAAAPWVGAVEGVERAERDRCGTGANRVRRPVFKVDDPDQLATGVEVFGGLGEELGHCVVGRHHIDREVRRAEREPAARRGVRSSRADETDAWTTHRVGIARKRKPRLDHHGAEVPRFDIGQEPGSDHRRVSAVIGIRGIHAHPPSGDQLGAARSGHLREQFSRNEVAGVHAPSISTLGRGAQGIMHHDWLTAREMQSRNLSHDSTGTRLTLMPLR